MYIYQAFHALVTRFAPMDNTASNELNSNAQDAYNKVRNSMLAKNKINENYDAEDIKNAETEGYKKKTREVLNPQEKIVSMLEIWWVRYFIAIAYIWSLPRVKAYVNGESLGNEKEDDKVKDMYEFYRMYERNKMMP